MGGTIACYPECGSEAGFGKHGSRVAANQKRLAGKEAVMVVKIKEMRVTGDAAIIDGNLSIIFANILKVV